MFLARTTFHILSFSSPVLSYFIWANPFDVGSLEPSDITFQVNELVELQWATNISAYSISLGQSLIPGCAYVCPDTAPGITIYTKTANTLETNGFSWNISSAGLINATTSTFWFFCTEGVELNGMGLPSSEAFNITDMDQRILISSNLATSSTTNLATKSTSSQSPSSTSFSRTTSTALEPSSPTHSAIDSKPSPGHSENKDLYVGIIAGLGSLVLSIALGFLARYYRKRSKNRETPLPQHTPDYTVQSSHMSSFETGLSSGKNELPTAFNNMRVMKSTLHVKCELPGKDNEISLITGPAELVVE